MKKFNTLLCAIFFATQIFAQTVSTFENLTLATDTFWNGSDLSGGFSSGNANFANDYDTAFHSWSGFTYSNKKDSTTSGYGNQYAAITASGYNGSANYAIADEYGNAKVRLTGNATGKLAKGFYVTNTTYTYLSMKNGDMFAKKFGGVTGSDSDWFRIRVIGWKNGALKQQAVDFFLADYRSADSTQDYIVNDWTWLDLQSLGDVDSILFNLSSSDTAFGYMNTPAYFAMDDFTTGDTAFAQPSAYDDELSMANTTDTLISVLANDSGLVVNPITVELIGSPQLAGATDSVLYNKILYVPAAGVIGTDTLVYRVCDNLQACATARVIVHVSGINSINSTNEMEIAILPNPFSNAVSVRSSVSLKAIELYNVEGTLVTKVSGSGKNQIKLSTEEISTGVYFLKVISDNGILLKKIVKQ